MKTKKSILTILAVVIVLIISAEEKPKTNVQLLNANQLLVTVQTKNATQMEATINNENGTIVYYKKSKTPISSYHKIFDVKNLENGEYSMKLKVNNLMSERKLVIMDDKIYVSRPDDSTPPFFSFDGKNLVLSHLNFENEKYKLEIYGNEGLVYKTSVGNKTTINAGFNLSKMETGNYVVFLNSAKSDFNYRFDKLSCK